MKATRPLQFIYFGPVSFQTNRDGVVYAFFAVDDYSKYVFNLGIDKNLTDLTILFYLKELLNHTNFRTSKPSFTIISAVGQHLEQEIQNIVGSSGRIVFDSGRVMAEIAPVIKSFKEYMSGL